ncbi:S8 family serine peptidase [Maritimibacter sp. 55A14]|uniref:S8 family serine peptidase n=1 Tax=Maritimibacter sp. 55A14 TaxID=2174844 RepID=UPI001304E004|nr:S8 family serine peptidase [Maritimibacter sp. 55A14]
MRKMIDLVPVECAIGIFLCFTYFSCGPALSQEKLLELNLYRELTETERGLLSELIIQNDTASVMENPLNSEPFTEVCDPLTCQLRATNAFNEIWTNVANSKPATPGTLNEFTRGLVIPGEISRDGRDYFVVEPEVEADGTVLGAIPGRYNTSDLSEFRAFPLDMENQVAVQDLSEWGLNSVKEDSFLPFWEPKSVPFTVISKDLSYSGESSRVFAIRNEISEERVMEIIAALRAGDVNASLVEESNTSLVQPVLSPFEGTGSPCGEGTSEERWPFDAVETEEIIAENRKWLTKMHLPVSRALILVVDTGIGEQLIEEGGQLSNLLAPKPSEILNPLVVYNDLPEVSGALECSDIDGDSYYWDAIGATGAPTVLDIGTCPFESVAPLRDHRLFPIPSKTGAADTATYVPGHGSFVSVLAAGGEALGARVPDLVDHLGLRFFKVTRKAESGSKATVRVERSALTNALKYAAAQRVNIVNLSMKTSDTNIRRVFEDPGVEDTLVVTSAGNLRQDLDNNGERTLPASLRRPNLIVVGALKNEEADPWWEDSAFGQSVSIAAPGVGIESVDENGSKVCFTGTSAATPTVSFTAAILYSFGFSTPGVIKDRILYSATFDRALVGKVEQGRRLDVGASIDVFVDRLTLGSGEVVRGRIVSENGSSARLIKLCSGRQKEHLAASGGRIDPFYLKSWRRDGNFIVFQDRRIRDEQRKCTFDSTTEIVFRKLDDDKTIPIELGSIESGLLSPFRSALVEATVLDD